MSIEFRGDFDFAQLNEKLAAAIPEAALAGGDFILDKAIPRTPLLVDLKRANQKRRAHPGELRESGYVKRSGNDAEIGFSSYWARWQHEREDYKHPDGQWKYLETTLLLDGHEALEHAARRLREEL